MYFDSQTILSSFDKVPLEEINNVKLMSRVDEKFVFHESMLSRIISETSPYYSIVTVNNKMIQEYNTHYFDTFDKMFFKHHHNNFYSRYKVRFRKYVSSGICFLEIKQKNNKKVTTKKRIKVNSVPSQRLNLEHQRYIHSILGVKKPLISQHSTIFNRMTFVHKMNLERLTIDINLSYKDNEKSGKFTNLVIAELKKPKSQSTSDFKKILKKHRVRPLRFSKYCMSTIKLCDNVKYNRFKEKLLLINKIIKK